MLNTKSFNTLQGFIDFMEDYNVVNSNEFSDSVLFEDSVHTYTASLLIDRLGSLNLDTIILKDDLAKVAEAIDYVSRAIAAIMNNNMVLFFSRYDSFERSLYKTSYEKSLEYTRYLYAVSCWKDFGNNGPLKDKSLSLFEYMLCMFPVTMSKFGFINPGMVKTSLCCMLTGDRTKFKLTLEQLESLMSKTLKLDELYRLGFDIGNDDFTDDLAVDLTDVEFNTIDLEHQSGELIRIGNIRLGVTNVRQTDDEGNLIAVDRVHLPWETERCDIRDYHRQFDLGASSHVELSLGDLDTVAGDDDVLFGL